MARRYAIIFGTPQRRSKGEALSDAVVIISRGIIQDDFTAVDWFEGAMQEPSVKARLKNLRATKGFLVEIIDERSL